MDRKRRNHANRIREKSFVPYVMGFALLMSCWYLWPLKADFNADWYNLKWAIGYSGEYFRHHGTMPAVFNTTQWGGIPAPIFYGNIGVPLLGLFSVILAPGMVIRLTVVLLFACQYHWIVQAVGRLQAPRWTGHAVACLVIWATYSFTNLFNRSALLEFIATSLLVCALSLAVLLVHAPSRALERRYASRMILCLVISAGTHPITAVFGIPFFCVVGVILWFELRENSKRRRSILRTLVPWFPAALACLSSWLYAMAKFTNHLTIRQYSRSVLFWPESWDHWLTRFYPIPLDPRVRPGVSLREIAEPYLDAQVNVPLLIFFVALCITMLWFRRDVRRRGTVFVAVFIPAALFAFFTWISLSPDSYHYLPSMFEMIQFAYRAITYQNLSLLFGVFLLLMTLPADSSVSSIGVLERPVFRGIAAACILLSLYGVTVKWPHIRASRTNYNDNGAYLLPGAVERRDRIAFPSQYLQFADYATPDLFIPLTAAEAESAVPVNFAFDSKDDFGVARPVQVALAEASWVRTNIIAFPWNRIDIDGRDTPDSDIRGDNKTGVALRVSAGNHRLVFRFVPDLAWKILRVISLLSLFCWLFIEIVFSVLRSAY
jgi:hypothetical protein